MRFKYRLGIDAGGTFTDLVLADQAGDVNSTRSSRRRRIQPRRSRTVSSSSLMTSVKVLPRSCQRATYVSMARRSV